MIKIMIRLKYKTKKRGVKMKISQAQFKVLYFSTTLEEMAKNLKVSIGTIKNYAKKLNLSKGKGNKVNHKKTFNF